MKIKGLKERSADCKQYKKTIPMDSDQQWQGSFFLHLLCKKNKLMNSFKFTGTSICSFT